MLYIVLLRQSWYDSRCTKGSYIHIIGNFDRCGQCIIDDADNMIILHPDHLISATAVATSFDCTRRAALQDRVKATSPAARPQVFGHILHEFFGEAMKMNDWDVEKLRVLIQTLLPKHLEVLYELQLPLNEAVDYVMSKVPDLKAWASTFVASEIRPNATIADRNGALVPFAINKLLEVEEHVWSPMYGLKGNIDATIQVQMQTAKDQHPKTLTVPLELKTGKKDNSAEHRAQTQLYTLLISDRYDINVVSGVLYYLETSKTHRIQGVRNEIRQMIIQRNELACYVHDKLDLPPMIKNERVCKFCYAQTSCFTYHKLVEGGTMAGSSIKEMFDEQVGHLQPEHQSFFKKWDDLLTKEERDSMKFKRELWTMLSKEREAVGRCFSKVMIESGSAVEHTELAKINRYQYSFVKPTPQPGFSFSESQLTTGEPIVISDERGHFALALGYVTNVRPHRITVAVDRSLQSTRRKGKGFHADDNQVFAGIMEVSPELPGSGTTSESPLLYRIDKDEFSNGMATARNNIIRMMENNTFRVRELRQLIIGNVAPIFKHTSTAYTLSGPASQQDINIDQRRAIEKVMSAKDYALVLGMPGTGKTTTIAHIIRALVSQNKSVLLTSYTHTAVDNILLKIKDDNIPTLRLGPTSKIHHEVQAFADLASIPKQSFEELDRSYHNSKVVATTCLGVNHPLFNARIFDYCIVDEASQLTLPVCLGPIRMAKTFILVGDHYQLPPLVQNKEAMEGGLNVSLFKLLSDAQSDSVVNLEHQYRMAEDIMLLSNRLIYNGRLKCGTPAVASRLLEIPNLERGLSAHHHTSKSLPASPQVTSICLSTPTCWLRLALDPSSRCRFLNTDAIPTAREAASGSRITNALEATLTAHLITSLIRSGVSPRSIGIITFYRSQLALLRQTIKSIAGTAAFNELELHTADRFQGRDKEVILLSCVRSNEARNVGELLRDWRRVNVAVTRARSKLLIVGSADTLGGCGVDVLEGLVGILKGKGWILDLPSTAAEEHFFESSATQGTQVPVPETHPPYQQRRKAQSGALAGTSVLETSAAARTPLAPLSPVRRTAAAKGNGRVHAPFKAPKKVVKGAVDVQRLLDKRPVMRDVVNEMLDENDEFAGGALDDVDMLGLD